MNLPVQQPLTPVITTEQLQAVKDTICKGMTDAHFRQYLYDCQRHNIHPLDKLIHPTTRGGRYVPITSIDFFRARATTTGEYAGYEARFEGEPGTPDFACHVTIKRIVQGQVHTWTASARWSEYYPGDGPEGGMWRKMKHNMLEKCAEALGLRRAFPMLSGLYTKEEMDQATPPPKVEPTLQQKLEQRIVMLEGEKV